MRKSLFSLALMGTLAFCGSAPAQQITVSPLPQNISWGEKAFDNTVTFRLTGAEDADADAVALLQDKLNTGEGSVELIVGESGDAAITGYESKIPTQAEGYYLKVEPGKVVVAGRDQSGTYYGVQTFLQVASQPNVMQMEVSDWPAVALRGVIEGFYGNPWSTTDRKRQFEFYGQNKMNVYVYGPKDDPYHRGSWRTPYPTAEGRVIKELAEYAAKHKVKFTWAIHPGGDIKFEESDYKALVAKLENVYSLGVRSFSVFFDDIYEANGEKQAEVLNYVTDNFVRNHTDVEPLSMCPTQYNKAYAGWQSTPYLQALGNMMYPEVQVMWTGNSVVDMIDQSDVDWIRNIIKRKPYIWLNYPVNDYCISRMLMGKTYGNGLNIANSLEAFASNPMEYAEASKVSLYSIADYSWNMKDYDAQSSWERAIKNIWPTEQEAFMVFCENNVDLGSTAHGLRRENESPRFNAARKIFENAMTNGINEAAVDQMKLQMDTLVWAAERLLADTEHQKEMIAEITPWVKKMQMMGQRGQLEMEMYHCLLNNQPTQFLEKYQQIQALQAQEDELISRGFEGSIKKARPVVGAEVITPFLKKQLGTLVQEYKARFKEGWETFGAVVLENGNYYIKYNGQYLTNANADANRTGDAPVWRSQVDITNPQKAEWTISIDPETDRYKIISTQDGRYLNENGKFWASTTGNPYEAIWHTYNITRMNGLYAIQNGGSAGSGFWWAGTTGVGKGGNASSASVDNFIFEIVPVSGEAPLHPSFDARHTYYIKSSDGRCLTDANHNGSGEPVFKAQNETDGIYQQWHLTEQGSGRWKLASAASKTAYINELGKFGTNAYSDAWNSYVLTECDGKWSIQNAGEAAKNGITYFGINGDKLQNNITERSKSYLFTLEIAGEADVIEWEDETIFGINKLDGHATQIPYGNPEEMRADAFYHTPWTTPISSRVENLNGNWQFKYSSTIAARPDGATVDGSGWASIPVPGCWEMQGYGTPMYINQDYAFQNNPPYIAIRNGYAGKYDENPVGTYTRTFTIPANWRTQRTILHFDGIYSAAFVWVNGQKAGYTQGANNDAEFDISNLLVDGENRLTVQVFRWSDGSYLEGQDMFHLSGIHRDVYLYNVPQDYVRDHCITWDGENLNVDIETIGMPNVTITLFDPKGNQIAQGTTAGTGSVNFPVSNAQVWTAETPNLYTVEVNTTDGYAFSTKYGLRTVEIKNNQLQLNGKRIFLRGVNSQDTHPLYGRTMDVETMLKDIKMWKQNNINCLRTSHYPRQAKMMAMLDHYGIYVIDEADVECHKNWSDGGNINSKSSWKAQIVDRTVRMVQRDRNHPSVVMWSLGNESGNGANFTASYAATRALDSRPIHYEGASRDANWNKSDNSDVVSVMYPSVSDVRNTLAKGQPYFICEFAHAMGNAVGNLKEYMDLLEEASNGVGGCIWDWVDQSIYSPAGIKANKLTKNGFPWYTSGYDYPGPHQDNFVNNGIVTADRAETPKLAEVKQVYSPVQFGATSKDLKSMWVYNKYAFSDLSHLTLRWSVLKNGVEIESGTTDMPATQPGERGTGRTPWTVTIDDSNAEYLLNVYALTKDATEWAEAGHVVSQAQYTIQERAPLATPDANGATLTATTSTSGITTYTSSNGKLKLLVSSNNNIMTRLDLGGMEKVIFGASNSPVYNNFRWIENDKNGDTDNGKGSGTTSIGAVENENKATATVEYTGTKCPYTLEYTAHAAGYMDMKATFNPANGELRRIGLAMQLDGDWEGVEYYGRGPWENYVDRQSGTFLGRYKTTVTEMFEQYPHPQTYGDRLDLRELRLINSQGDTLVIETEGQVGFSVSHYNEEDFTQRILHPWDLTKQNATYLHFDYYHRGVGNGSCGANTGTLDTYKCPTTGDLTFTLRLSVLRKDHTPVGIESIGQNGSKSATTYDLQGRRVSEKNALRPGLYITDGKVILKK